VKIIEKSIFINTSVFHSKNNFGVNTGISLEGVNKEEAA